jgi:2-polyprenyl-6-methoxyphenol hydroxylase-like FAD-dependent oxidoreductase
MKVLIAGGGIGGLTAALALHHAGIEVEVYEQARDFRELGVGINLLPHAVKVLQRLGLLSELDRAGVRTRCVVFATRLGQPVWYDPRGLDAGYDAPQLSIHRGRLHGILLQAARQRLGSGHIQSAMRLVNFRSEPTRVVAAFEQRSGGPRHEIFGDVLIGADGIHSTVRVTLFPDDGPPVWNGVMLWRGAREWPVYADGRTMLVAGGNAAKFVVYPLHRDAGCPDMRLTNWAVAARTGDGSGPPPRREDWNRPGHLDEVLPFVRDHFRISLVDAEALVKETEHIFEYPMCDREPLPRWSFGRVTLLGDAAHPMYPTGSNGASQAILDAAALARHLRSKSSITDALAAYDAERRPVTEAVVYANRHGGSEGVIDLVEARAPNGFDDLDGVASYAERAAIVAGYARLAGYTREQVNGA